jgi:5-methylcytosine-specific restriction endonuclease McrA
MAYGEANGIPCVLCNRPIDYGFTRVWPNHRLAGTVHHLTGLAQGGDPLDTANLAPAHRGCNTRESNRIRAGLATIRRPRIRNSRRW